jgi:hypothetical protein
MRDKGVALNNFAPNDVRMHLCLLLTVGNFLLPIPTITSDALGVICPSQAS